MADPQEIARKYRTPRWHELNRLRAYVQGTQYEGRPAFGDTEVPLQERGPDVVLPIVKKAYRSNCDFVFGEGRWPTITSFGSEDDDDGLALSENDSEALDKLISKAIEQSRFKAAIRNALHEAQSVTSAVLVGCVIAGKLHIQSLKAEECEPQFDPLRPNEVSSLECKYPYLEDFKGDDGLWKTRCMLYRRVIDGTHDTTFKPAEATDNGAEPSWEPDPAQTFEHQFGFCPVVWYAFKGRCSGSDGESMHKPLTGEIDALNFAASMRHRASVYSGDPQIVETGVDLSANPSEAGRLPFVYRDQGMPTADGRDTSYNSRPHNTSGGTTARRKGAGVVWRYETKDVNVFMLTLPPGALEALEHDVRDLKTEINDALAVVDIDVHNAKLATDMSGKALEVLYRKQTDHCGTIREDAGEGLLLRALDMLLRIVLAVGTSRPGALYLSGLKKAVPILKRFIIPVRLADGTEQPTWFPPHLDLIWGPWFAATANDETNVIQTCKAARDAKLATKKSCLEKLKAEGIFAIDSVDEYLEALTQEEPVEAAPAEATGNETEPTEAAPVIDLAPTDLAVVVTANEARASKGLGPLPADGELTIAEYKAKHVDVIATAAAADLGDTKPGDGKPKPMPFGGGGFKPAEKSDEKSDDDQTKAEPAEEDPPA